MSAPVLTIANAPCSYGAWELTVAHDGFVPPAEQVLDALAQAGYDGVDLGPIDYLGEAGALHDDLRGRGLGLAGAFAPLPFSDPVQFAAALPSLDRLLDHLDVVTEGQELRPKPTLADAGSELRRRFPATTVKTPARGWHEREWRHAAAGIAQAAERCRERGYDPTFHHHTATSVEAVWEVERLLELTDVGLCFDTGHLAVVGGDPVSSLRAWGERINHVHIKDARAAVIASVLASEAPSEELWMQEAFCRLGTGDLDLQAVATGLREIGYSGWVVVEQDTVTADVAAYEVARDDQVENRRFLAGLGL
jgi:inosose dehydratase